jgi:hypothetical protein
MGVPVEYVQPQGRFCPHCGSSYGRSSRLIKSLLLATTPVLAMAAIFGVIFLADLKTAVGLVVVAVAGLALWLILVRPGSG